MLFRIIDHYESENKDIDEEIVEEIDEEIHEETRECFVCFEIQFDNNDIISLKNQTNYYKFCKCDGYIHVNCLNLWYEKNPECPICRNSMKQIGCLELYYLYECYICLLYICLLYLFLVIKKKLADTLLFVIKISHIIFLLIFIFNILHTINRMFSDIIYELENKMYNYYELYHYNDVSLYHYNDVSLYHYNNYSLENYREPLVNTIIPS